MISKTGDKDHKNVLGGYQERQALSSEQIIRVHTPATLQLWHRATSYSKSRIQSLCVSDNKGKNRSSHQTWFTEPSAPLRFWGAISTRYTGT